MSPARAQTRTARSGDERTNHEATAPLKISSKAKINGDALAPVFPRSRIRFDIEAQGFSEMRYCLVLSSQFLLYSNGHTKVRHLYT